VLKLMIDSIDLAAARYASTALRAAVLQFARPVGLAGDWLNISVFEPGGNRLLGDQAVKTLVVGAADVQSGGSVEWAAFFFGDLIKSKIAASFGDVCPRDYPDRRGEHPSLDARFESIAALSDELAAVTAELDATLVEIRSLPPAPRG